MNNAKTSRVQVIFFGESWFVTKIDNADRICSNNVYKYTVDLEAIMFRK